MADLRTPPQVLGRLLETLRRRWVAVVAIFALTVGAALAVTLSKAAEYSATAQILLQPSDAVGQLVNPGSLPSPANAQRDVDTNARLITSRPVLDLVRAQIGSRASDEELASKVQVDGQADSSLISITVTDASVGAARRLATALAQQYRAYRQASAQDAVRQAIDAGRDRLDELRRTGAPAERRAALRTRLAELETNAAVATGGVQIVQLPIPAEGPAASTVATKSETLADAATQTAGSGAPRPAASPVQDNLTLRKLALTVVAAGFVGALLAVGGALALQAADRRLWTAEEVEAAFGVPVLGSLPVPVLGSLPVPAVGRAGERHDADAYADLAASLGFSLRGGGPRTLMISPASRGISGSAVAARLATQLASARRRVMVVDTQLVASAGGPSDRGPQARGLAEILAGDSSLADELAVVHVVPGSANSPGVRARDVISYELLSAGEPVDNPAALLGRPVLATTMRDALARADVVLIDAGAPVPVSRSAPVAALSERILLLARARRTTDADANAARRALGPLYDRVVGVVLLSDPVASRPTAGTTAFAAAADVALPAHVAPLNGTNGYGPFPPAGPVGAGTGHDRA